MATPCDRPEAQRHDLLTVENDIDRTWQKDINKSLSIAVALFVMVCHVIIPKNKNVRHGSTVPLTAASFNVTCNP